MRGNTDPEKVAASLRARRPRAPQRRARFRLAAACLLVAERDWEPRSFAALRRSTK
jgi:hypothetical protein